jgi:ABC-2 type transport system permease protein
VADVVRSVSVVRQIALIAGLRWRLLHNGLRKKQNRLDLIGVIVLAGVAAIIVTSVSIGAYVAAYNFVATHKEGWLAVLFWAIFFWWQFFPIIIAGFGASFEFRMLLRFPMSFRAFYAIGLAYGLADFTGAAALCWVIAVMIGAVSANLALLPALIFICVPFVLFNLTLERLLGSWLERLLARRQSRELFFAAFILAMLSLQFLGPALSRYGNSAGPWVARILPYLAYFPASLAGRGVASAATGNWKAAVLEIGGIALYAICFGGLLWQRFAVQYRGEELSETAAPLKRERKIAATGKVSGDVLGLLSPQVAAVVRKEFSYLVRNGFAALLLFLPPILVFGLVTQASVFRFTGAKANLSLEMFFPGLVAYLTLFLMSPAYNSFAYEGAGVQTYFTAPLRFRVILLGKNFVQICLLGTELALCIGAFIYRVGAPSQPILVATLTAIVFTVVGQLCIANWSSLSFPRKLAFGQVHGQRQSGMAVLVAFGTQILLFGVSTLILGLGHWTGDRWLPTKAFAMLSAAAIGGYAASLDPLSAYAEKKKEKLIEALCK